MTTGDDDLRLALERALDRIDALEHEVRDLRAAPPPTPASDLTETTIPPAAATPLDRRRLISRAGMTAVGAMLGGTVAAVAAASPAAAATGTFDQVEITGSQSPALRVQSGVSPRPDTGALIEAAAVGVIASGAQWGVHGAAEGVGVFGHGGSGYGVMAVGARANLFLKEPGSPYPSMVPPLTRTDAHQRGELYFDSNSDLWLCIADGSPGTWARLGGATNTGVFSSSTSDPALRAGNTSTNGSALIVSSAGQQATAMVVSANPSQGIGIAVTEAQTGVLGKGTGMGVVGEAPTALVGVGQIYGAALSGKTAQVVLDAAVGDVMPPPLGRIDAHKASEIYFDDDNDLWLCVADGTPGTWVRLAGPGSAGAFTVLRQPVRVYDSATAGGPFTGTRHGIDLTARASGLPTDATAAVVNVGITNTLAQTNSYLKVYADDLTTPPPTTAIRWRDAKELLSATITTRVTAAKLAVQINGTANLTIDVIAYYR